MVDDGGSEHPADLDLALVSAAILIGKKLNVKTALVEPDGLLDIQDVTEVVAKEASPPLRVSVARDLASAGFSLDEMKPLLLRTLPDGSVVSGDADLEKHRAELAKLGPTVSWPNFPPGGVPEMDMGAPS